MRTRNYGLFALAVAVVAVGAMASEVPLRRIAVLGLFLACPVMMSAYRASSSGLLGPYPHGTQPA